MSAQSLAALANANRIRLRHAAVIRSIASPADAADVLRNPPADTDRLRLGRVLKAVPGYGPVRTTRLLNAAAVQPMRTQRGLGELTERERNRIADALVAPRLTPTQRRILATLNGAALDRRELLQRTGTTGAGLDASLAALEGRGLVSAEGTGWRRT